MINRRKEKKQLRLIEETVKADIVKCETALTASSDSNQNEIQLRNIDEKLDCLNIIDELIKLSHGFKKANLYEMLIQDCFGILNGFGNYNEKLSNMMIAIEDTIKQIHKSKDKKIDRNIKSQMTLPLMGILASFIQRRDSIHEALKMPLKYAQNRSSRMFSLKLPNSEDDSSPRSSVSPHGLVSSREESREDTGEEINKTPKGATPK
jgi:hypothetical protein